MLRWCDITLIKNLIGPLTYYFLNYVLESIEWAFKYICLHLERNEEGLEFDWRFCVGENW